jgi:hypothetical protein
MKIISVKPHGIRIFIGERINLKLESHQRPGGLRMGAVEITGVELANIRDRITVNEKPVELGNVKVSPSKITLTWKQWGAKPRDELLILVGQLLDGKPIKLGRVETMLSSLFIRQDRANSARLGVGGEGAELSDEDKEAADEIVRRLRAAQECRNDEPADEIVQQFHAEECRKSVCAYLKFLGQSEELMKLAEQLLEGKTLAEAKKEVIKKAIFKAYVKLIP